MAAPPAPGPGLLLVNSEISHPEILNEETFIKCLSLRFQNKDPKAERPYLVLYPMGDIGFTQSDEFKKIGIYSDLLPGGAPINDIVDMDVRVYSFIDKYEPNGPVRPGQTKLLIPGGFDLGDKITEQDFHDWYNKEHFGNLAKVPGYLRSTRYQLLGHRSNGQLRAARGFPPREEDVETPTPVKFLALHEFTVDEVDMKAFISTIDTDWSKRILGGAARAENPAYYQFKQGYGDGTLF
ncbi:hypothetical protein L207DRAFT_640428 [Hyaloscypha variabilis F]|uniref:Uncharacterized protein n=1 Tax=Hyaloscypha variabilis (strain UAMH 11265 / GT02V1 / F) TaxID=1149755 RepID=A0A2J6R0T4_HYAVF|nr:hypothetical protein L207DRAFT_640428 [Hyaloscypha variabilis F]